MDAALGAPESMVEADEELTPMIRQYVDLCEEYDDCLVLFHVGDFYKVFCEAAETVSRLCELTLASREDSTGEYPMTGIRVDKAEAYIEKLLDAGYRVAVAEQVEDPETVSGVADRQVTRVITPGTVTEDELLDDAHNFVACLTGDGDGSAPSTDRRFGLALLDVSTGDFYATTVDGVASVRDEASRFSPAEVVFGPEISDSLAADVFDPTCVRTPFDEAAFALETAHELVARYFGEPESQLVTDVEVRACGGLLAYAEYARGGADEPADERDGPRLDYLNHLTRYDPREYVLLDAVALRSLELFERRTVRGIEGASLADVVDETASALGSRELTDWLRRPLLEEARIDARHDAVEELVGDVRTRERLHDRLRDVYDVERLISRVARGRANARDLRSLRATLAVVPDLRDALEGADSDLLSDLRADLDPLADVRETVEDAIVPDPPVELTEGGLVREGYDDELDDLRATKREGQQWIADLQARERERTGIDNLEVGHTDVHGYYIEVTDANLDRVPEEYTRRQTLKNAERFYTPALKRREDEIFRAEKRADDLEYRLFRDVRADVAAESERVQRVAAAVAALDALVALATVAAEHDYCRPEMGADAFEIEAGRHPVVERTQSAFVPNDTYLDRGTVAVVTGPNMSGKSTYMRQVALIAILAQAGGFVPAAAAALPVVDRVFTRVGASDDIAGGRSTFMVEMTELAEILRSATADSLVLLDEVGRGTATADGFAIARAVTEHLHDEVGATTLFATHHHDLTEVAADLPRAHNLHFAAERVDEGVEFDHEVNRGAATASYGVEVAREAGVPDAVVDRAREVVDGPGGDAADATDERRDGHRPLTSWIDGARTNGHDEQASGATANGHGEAATGATANATGSSDDGANASVDTVLRDRLREVDVGNTTPIEALNELAELKALLEEP